MKKTILAVITIIFTLSFFAGCASQATETQHQNYPVFSVNDVQHDPLAFTGVITIHGVVTMHMPSGFGVEYTQQRACCPDFVLHVAFDGNAPAIGETVYVTGSFVHTSVFQATQVRPTR
ncbi:MAG: hypothetical protein FWD06_02650 [Oscillospiraceae bacterium]|nr:hypothetical protein [Oscillospiraceae bacterium]